MDNLEKRLDEVKQDLSQPAPEHKAEGKSPTKGERKMAKKVVKKVAKKVTEKAPKRKKASAEGKVTLADLASEAKIGTGAARRKLRGAELAREGRWSWEEGSSALKAARKALGLE